MQVVNFYIKLFTSTDLAQLKRKILKDNARIQANRKRKNVLMSTVTFFTISITKKKVTFVLPSVAPCIG